MVRVVGGPSVGATWRPIARLLRLWQVHQIAQVVKPVRPDIVSQETRSLLYYRIVTN